MDAKERPLQGKVAIVTDSGRTDGVSRVAALAVGRLGASVAITYTYQDNESEAAETAQLVREAGSQAFIVRGRSFLQADAGKLVALVLEHFGVKCIDILSQSHQSLDPSLQIRLIVGSQ